MAKKAIIWSRASTTQQEIESQKRDLTTQAIKDGFKSKDLIYIGKAGASAIKLNTVYQQEVNELIKTIEEQPDVDCIYVWEISRLARNEVAFYQMKSKIIERHIQLICNVPSLRLFDINGELNNGAELTLNLLVTLAKQEMEIKRKRFERGKKKKAGEDKFVGGKDKYGYYHDENGNYLINEEEADVVRLIYQLRTQKSMSKRGIYKELQSRGIKRLGPSTIQNILTDISYTGARCTHRYCKYERTLPLIITHETFQKAQEVGMSNRTNNKSCENPNLGFKILKCPECGGAMTFCPNRNMYRCIRRKERKYNDDTHQCHSSCTINSDIIESLLWQLAKFKERKAILNRKAEDKEVLKSEKEVIDRKIVELDNRLEKLKVGLQRMTKDYYSGELSDEDYDKLKKSNKQNQKLVQNEIQGHKHQLKIIGQKLKSFDEQMSLNEYLKLCVEIEMTNNLNRMSDIVSTYISKAVVAYKDETKQDKTITVYYTDGTSERFIKPYKEQCVIADGFPSLTDDNGLTTFYVFKFDLKTFSKIHRGSTDSPESILYETYTDEDGVENIEPITQKALHTYEMNLMKNIHKSKVKNWRIKYRTM